MDLKEIEHPKSWITPFFISCVGSLLATVLVGCSIYQSPGRECMEKGSPCIDLTFSQTAVEAQKYCVQGTMSDWNKTPSIPPKSQSLSHSIRLSETAFESVKADFYASPKGSGTTVLINAEMPSDDFRAQCQLNLDQSPNDVDGSTENEIATLGLDFAHALLWKQSQLTKDNL